MKVDKGGEWLDDVLAGFTAYYLTSLPVFLGVLFAIDFSHPGNAPSSPSPDFVSACFHLDADHYLEIVRQGYSYHPQQRSMVAFFPAYPLLSRWLGHVTGLSAEEALLLTAHAALLGIVSLCPCGLAGGVVELRRAEDTSVTVDPSLTRPGIQKWANH